MTLARTPLGTKDVVVRGQSLALDTANLTAAINQLNAWGQGTLWIEGTVKYDLNTNLLGEISVQGLGTDATLEYQSGSGITLGWNTGWAWNTNTAYDFTMTNAFAHGFTTAAFTPSAGEFVLLYSDDEIANVFTHNRNGAQSPMELHEVYHWDASAPNFAYVRDYIVDDMQTTPKATIVPMYKGVRVSNLRFTLKDGEAAGDYSEYINMKTCQGAVIENCHFGRGMGPMQLYGCADSLVSKCVMEGMNTDGAVYGITMVLTNNVRISKNTINGYRHGVTTSSGRESGTTRWGTPLHTTVQNNTITTVTEFEAGEGTSTHAGAVHSHAEGYDLVVKGNQINVQGNIGNIGVVAFCRNMQIVDNEFIGGFGGSGVSSAFGVSIYSPDCEVSDNTFRRLYQGVKCSQAPDFYNRCNNLVVDNNRFIDIRTVPIRLGAGDDQSCTHNRFRNCGGSSNITPQNTKAHIQFGSISQYPGSFEDGGTTLTTTGDAWNFSLGADYYDGQEIFFTGVSLPSNITADTIYYVKAIASNTTGTIAATRGGAAIPFAVGGGSGTVHLGHMTGSGHRVANNVSFKESNDHFCETQNMDTDDVEFAGNTVIGYGGNAFSDRYSKDDDFQNEYGSLNTGM